MAEYMPKHQGGKESVQDSLLELRKSVGRLLARAGVLGMAKADMYFSSDMADGSRLRLAGGPIRLRIGDDIGRFLRLTENRIYEGHPDSRQDGYVLVSEHIIGRGGVSTQPAIVSLDSEGVFDHRSPNLPPIIWESAQDGGPHLFRGNQLYTLPQTAIGSSAEGLMAQQWVSNSLCNTLNRLTPGCHDAMYPPTN